MSYRSPGPDAGVVIQNMIAVAAGLTVSIVCLPIIIGPALGYFVWQGLRHKG